MLKWIFAALVLLFIVSLVLPRMVSDDPERWHVDPRTAQPSDKPNSYLVADYDAVTLPLSPDTALARIDAIAMAEPRVSRLARDGDARRVTYAQRSAIFGFPDYISIAVEPKGAGSSVTIFSRSRFGHSDLGVNKARVEKWLEALESSAEAG